MIVTKVFIHKCSHPMYWYNSHIGERVNVHREESDRYWVREVPGGYTNFVMKEDAEPVEYFKPLGVKINES